jgi:hypothetical protein
MTNIPKRRRKKFIGAPFYSIKQEMDNIQPQNSWIVLPWGSKKPAVLQKWLRLCLLYVEFIPKH